MKRTVSSLATFMLAGTLVLHASPAWADPVEEGTQHFQRGVTLYREGDLNGALVEFRRAYELSPSFKILYNIGQAEVQLGHYVEAIAAFEQYLATGGSQVPSARRTEVSEDLQRLRQRVGTIMVRSNVVDAALSINGEPRGRLPLAAPIALNVGRHTIELRDGERVQAATVDLPGGEAKTVNIDFPVVHPSAPPPPPAPVAQPPPEPRTTASYTPAWISFGVAAAATAGAVTFGVLAYTADRSHRDELGRPHGGVYDAEGEASKIRTYSLVSDVLTGAAVLSAGVGIYFLLRPPTHTVPSSQVGVGPGSLSFTHRF